MTMSLRDATRSAQRAARRCRRLHSKGFPIDNPRCVEAFSTFLKRMARLNRIRYGGWQAQPVQDAGVAYAMRVNLVATGYALNE